MSAIRRILDPQQLQADLVLTHPMIVAELACGTPPEPRLRTLGDLDLMEKVQQATLTEVRDLIERERLYGLGCGLVDLSLLASTMLMRPAKLWTLDKSLGALAMRFGVMHRPALH
ncbi:VapC toxin family PIN domain ribonuclease [Variovorax sp. LjRoot290]|uniref:VapC toxin family PIN domain ribonuclease n=1 Tax=unclassified Variovorax TaxID=663243 RepID=UPI003ECEAC35